MRTFTEEHKKKLSEAKKGKSPWNKGLKGVQKQTKETISKRVNSIREKALKNGYLWHSPETLKKISISLKGKKLSSEHRKKLSDSHKGYQMPEKYRNLRAEATKKSEKFNSVDWSSVIKENWEKYPYKMGRTGQKTSAETRKKQRISAIRYIEETRGQLRCNLGKNEKIILDEQEKKDSCKIVRQFVIRDLGYIVDGYCPETNTVYEVYEVGHKKQVDRDAVREKEIVNHLICQFKIIWDSEVKTIPRNF